MIATSIYPPEVGGPAYYSSHIAEALTKQGHSVDVVLYGVLRRFPSGFRHALYALKLLARSLGADGIVAFDTYTVGLPAVLVSLVTRVPLVVRIGGDFVWELYVERTRDLIPLPEVYEKRDRWNWKERVSYAVTRFVVRHARLAFSTQWLLDIWKREYGLGSSARVVENALEERIHSERPARKSFLFYARPIALKNLDAFRRAFAKAKKTYPDIELEEGRFVRDELIERLRSAYAVAVPSLSEVSPNLIIDAIRCGKPFILTKYGGYAERFKDLGLLVDPRSEDDMTRAIKELADEATYARLSQRIRAFTDVRTYDAVAREFTELLSSSPLRR
jgi:glycosyltransferase involved in cell wall biosynthesis